MLITTPIRIAAATITRRRFCRMTLPVSVPVMILVMRESMTTNATLFFLVISYKHGLSLHPIRVFSVKSLHTPGEISLLLGSGLTWLLSWDDNRAFSASNRSTRDSKD